MRYDYCSRCGATSRTNMFLLMIRVYRFLTVTGKAKRFFVDHLFDCSVNGGVNTVLWARLNSFTFSQMRSTVYSINQVPWFSQSFLIKLDHFVIFQKPLTLHSNANCKIWPPLWIITKNWCLEVVQTLSPFLFKCNVSVNVFLVMLLWVQSTCPSVHPLTCLCNALQAQPSIDFHINLLAVWQCICILANVLRA